MGSFLLGCARSALRSLRFTIPGLTGLYLMDALPTFGSVWDGLGFVLLLVAAGQFVRVEMREKDERDG